MNIYGLDSEYFAKKLSKIVREIDSYTPQKMCLALDQLKTVAESQSVRAMPNTRAERNGE